MILYTFQVFRHSIMVIFMKKSRFWWVVKFSFLGDFDDFSWKWVKTSKIYIFTKWLNIRNWRILTWSYRFVTRFHYIFLITWKYEGVYEPMKKVTNPPIRKHDLKLPSKIVFLILCTLKTVSQCNYQPKIEIARIWNDVLESFWHGFKPHPDTFLWNYTSKMFRSPKISFIFSITEFQNHQNDKIYICVSWFNKRFHYLRYFITKVMTILMPKCVNFRKIKQKMYETSKIYVIGMIFSEISW